MTSFVDMSVSSARSLFSQGTIKEYTQHKRKIHTLDWNSRGTKLATGSLDTVVRIWSLETHGLEKGISLHGHTESVDQLAWHPSQDHVLATTSCDRSIRVWDVRIGKFTHELRTKGENINITWRPDGNVCAVGNKDDTISFLDVRTWKITKSMSFKYEVNEITWNPTGELFLMTTGLGTVEVIDLESHRCLLSVPTNTGSVYCINFDRSGRYFAVGGADALVGIFDACEFACLRTFDRSESPVRTLSLSFDGTFIASGSEEHTLDISHVETGEMVHQIQGKGASNSIAFHPNKMVLAFAGDEKNRHGHDEGSVGLFLLPQMAP